MYSTLEEIRQRWLSEVDCRIAASCPGSELVATMCRYHLGTGGKRIRALLPIWVCANFGGSPEDAVEFGVGLELLHNATLIHDDIQDEDTHRRGKPAVWKRWGVAQAINAGDALIFQALRHFALGPAGHCVVPLVCERMAELIEGQALDLEFQWPEPELQTQTVDDAGEVVLPSLERWMQAARRKTGALFALCFQLGVHAARVEARWQIHAAEFGYLAGLAFQVADDLLEFVGDKGRRSGGDLMLGKLSFPILWAYEHANAEQLGVLRRVMRGGRVSTTPEMVQDARYVLDQCGAVAATKEWLRMVQDELQAHVMARIVPGLAKELAGRLTTNGTGPGHEGIQHATC